MKKLHTCDLDEFVNFIDLECKGNIFHPKVREKYTPISLVHRTPVDESIDPFSEEYFSAQLALYKEISGRPLNQWTGELHPADIETLLNCANPQGIRDVGHLSESVRAVSTMLSLCCFGEDAKVLDMGAGHGMSSEVYAFCGGYVHAVDIDPLLSELAQRRAHHRSLRITRSVLNFDSIDALENGFYDGAFFFQSLHHALRPWDLIAQLKLKLTDKGIIAFTGEPVQSQWKHWGLRRDEASLYVARKYGWFESGWSQEFITSCFARNGLKLILLTGGHAGGLMGIASKDVERHDQILAKAKTLGFHAIDLSTGGCRVQNYLSQIGVFSDSNSIRPTIRTVRNHIGGYLCHGPYIALKPGQYRVSFVASLHLKMNAPQQLQKHCLIFDIISGGGKFTYHKSNVFCEEVQTMKLVVAEITLHDDVFDLETRVFVSNSDEIWEVSLPRIEALDGPLVF
jgi:SAM-dependent methyltransferase